MEKTQSASISISIIDHFVSVDDSRMERAGKRKIEDIIAGAIRTGGKPPKGRSRRLTARQSGARRVGGKTSVHMRYFITSLPAQGG